MSVIFSSATSWKTQKIGDIVRAYHWFNGQPAMVLYPVRKNTLEAGAYVIELSAAFKYEDIHYLIRQSAIAARVMGMGATKSTIHRIGTAIHDGLLSLLVMPPEPVWHKNLNKGHVVAEIEVKKEGKTIIEREVYSNDRGHARG